MGSGASASRSTATVTLYIFPLSAPCRAVLLTAKIAKVPYETKLIDLLKGEQNGEEFLKINPDHCVPTLVSSDFRLWESRAIMKYLVDSYAPGHDLYPTNPEKRARVDRFLFYDLATVTERVMAFMRPQLFQNEPADPEKQQEVEKVLEYLEKSLVANKTKFFAADHVTIADISIMASVSMLELNQWDFSRWPKLEAWRKEIKKLPSYDEINKPLDAFGDKRRADRK